MGFGILMGGYALAFAFTLSPFYFFDDVIGGLIMIYAFTKLGAFQKKFYTAIIPASLYVLESGINATVMLAKFTIPDIVSMLLKALIAVTVLVLNLIIFGAVISLTEEIGLDKIAFRAKRNMLLLIVYYALYSLVSLFSKPIYDFVPFSSVIAVQFFTLFEFICLALNIILLGSCCKWIGIEGEEMPVPPEQRSRLSKLNDKWSEAEKRIFTPKEKRNVGEEASSSAAQTKPNKKKKK